MKEATITMVSQITNNKQAKTNERADSVTKPRPNTERVV
jgi:hypothetical protein